MFKFSQSGLDIYFKWMWPYSKMKQLLKNWSGCHYEFKRWTDDRKGKETCSKQAVDTLKNV